MIKIPDKALEAGARALARYNCEKWDNDPDRWTRYFRDEARAAFLAMIEAWPGKGVEHREVLNFGNNIDGPIVSANRVPFLILPLPPQEITLNTHNINAVAVKSAGEGITPTEQEASDE